MVVVLHQYIAMDEELASIMIAGQNRQELLPVPVLQEDVLLLVAPASDMVEGSRVFYGQRSLMSVPSLLREVSWLMV